MFGLVKSVGGVHAKTSSVGSFDTALNCKGSPITTDVSLPAFTIICGITFIWNVSNKKLGQPLFSILKV